MDRCTQGDKGTQPVADQREVFVFEPHLFDEEGDTICVTDAADGSLRVTATNPEVTRQLEVAQRIIRRYRNTLRELAK